MTGRTYRITTLGCRVNHAESRQIASMLESFGLRRAQSGAAADLEVVHSCTVTHSAAAKSRHAIRRARRRNQDLDDQTPGSEPLVLVTGCFVTSDRQVASRLAGGDDRIFEHDHPDGDEFISRLRDRIDTWLQQFPPAANGASRPVQQSAYRLPLMENGPTASRHIRAELHIQDGCDAHCTFCIIPKIRRTLRSKSVSDVTLEAARLVALGHQEIVLTGIFIGAYGHETSLRHRQRNRYASPLADLIDAVAQVPGLERLRISSMEPGDVDEPLLDAMVANRPVVVPHLHLPLQSGSDTVLRRMNRQYRVGEYLEMVDQVHDSLTIDGLPPAITTDVICGFPGESNADFERTVQVAERVGFLHMHVFPFSPREGTAAARWKRNVVPEPVRKERVHRLIALEDDPERGLARRFRRKLEGRDVRVIIEQPDASQPDWMRGRCDHYVPVRFKTHLPRGRVVTVHVDQIDSQGVTGQLQNCDRALPLAV